MHGLKRALPGAIRDSGSRRVPLPGPAIVVMLETLFLLSLLAEPVSFETAGVVSVPVYEFVLNREVGRDWRDAPDERLKVALETFLQQTGYSLASVKIERVDDTRVIAIDEGLLDGIVFPLQSGLRAFAARALINLPQQVYNEHLIARELERLEEVLGVEVLSTEIVPVSGAKEVGWLETRDETLMSLVPGGDFGDFQLRIMIKDTGFTRGPRLRVDAEAPDGLVTTLLYRTDPVFASDDAFEIGVNLGLRRSSEPSGRFSRGGATLKWYSRTLGDSGLRLRAGGEWRVIQRGRPDLDIDRYFFYELRPNIGVELDITRTFELEAQIGVQQRNLLELDAGENAGDFVTPTEELRPYAALEGELILGSLSRRAPFRHEIDFELEYYFGEQSLVTGLIEYEKAFAIGWDAIFLEVSASFAQLEPAINEERRVSDLLLGVFGDNLYSATQYGVQAEYRIAFARDRIAVGPVANGVVYFNDGPKTAAATGLGLHGRLLDNFAVSLYGAVGWTKGFEPNFGLSLGIEQIF